MSYQDAEVGKHGHHSMGHKLKHPFHEMKEKFEDALEETHLKDLKVSLIHKKWDIPYIQSK